MRRENIDKPQRIVLTADLQLRFAQRCIDAIHYLMRGQVGGINAMDH